MQEIFKPIKWFENYEVSNQWDVKSLWNDKGKTEKILKKWHDTKWYLQVWLFKNWKRQRKYIHRLVADAFIERPKNKKYVNHKNWVRSDNRVENLEWMTSQENNRHKTKKLWKNNKYLLNRIKDKLDDQKFMSELYLLIKPKLKDIE